MTRFYCLLFFTYLFSSLLSVSALAAVDGKRVIKICSESGFVPFEMKDNSGQWSGFDIELIEEFAKQTQSQIVMIDIALDGLIPALTTKKCDIIASGLTVTEERSKVVQFSVPVYTVTVTAALLDNTSNRSRFKKFEDLDKPGLVLASQTGSAATLYLRRVLKHATLMEYGSENDELNALLQGKAIAFVDDNVFIAQVRKKIGKKILTLSSNEKGDVAFAVRPENQALLKELNAYLLSLRKKEQWKDLIAKYF